MKIERMMKPVTGASFVVRYIIEIAAADYATAGYTPESLESAVQPGPVTLAEQLYRLAEFAKTLQDNSSKKSALDVSQ